VAARRSDTEARSGTEARSVVDQEITTVAVKVVVLTIRISFSYKL